MQESKIVIQPRRGLEFINWKEIYEFRDLFLFMIWRNIRVRYAQSTIGIGWAIVQPLFSMIVFTVIFGKLAKVDSNGVPYAIFSYTALVPWTYFANAITEGTQSLVANAHMLRKVYFPRVILPMAAIVARALDFGIALVFLVALMFWYGVMPTWNIWALPILILILVITASGFSLWLTALSVQYRDINYAINFIVQLLMYAAPVVYPTTLIPEHLRIWYAINPMVGVIEGFRASLLGTIPMPWTWILIGFLYGTFLAISGIVYFRVRERFFADVA